MATQTNLNVSLTQRFMDMVRNRVDSGRYQSASEVIREGLRLLEQRDQQEVFWDNVRTKIAEGQSELRAGQGIPGGAARAEMETYMRRKRTAAAKKRAQAKRA